MNIRFSIIIVLLTCRICPAQFVKGTHLLNLSINANYNFHSEAYYGDTTLTTLHDGIYNYHITMLGINPSFGFFIKENILVSIGPTYLNQVNKFSTTGNYYNNGGTYSNENSTISNYYGGQISLQRFYNLNGRLYWDYYLNASYKYGVGKINKIDVSNYSRTWYVYSDNVGFMGGLGFAYYLNDYWLVNGGIGNLSWTANWSKKTKSNSSDVGSKFTENNFGFNALYLSLGLSFVIRSNR